MSENDSVNTQSEKGTSAETTYVDVYNDYGDVVDTTSTTTVTPGSSAEEKFNIGAGSSSGGDIENYGSGTGSSETLARENPSSTGLNANNTELGKVGAKGNSIKTPDPKTNPLADATNSGEGKAVNGAVTDAAKRVQGLVENRVYEITPTKWSWRNLSLESTKTEVKSGDTVSSGNSISAESKFVSTPAGNKAKEQSSKQSGVGYKVSAKYETKGGAQNVSRPILMGGAEVFHVGPSTATQGHPDFVNLISSGESLVPGSVINIQFEHHSGAVFQEFNLNVK